MDPVLRTKPPEVKHGRLSWHLSAWIHRNLWLLNVLGGRLTLVDSFGTPGDTLLTGVVARTIRRHHPRIRINCITPNPELLKHDPDVAELNGEPGLIILRFWYLDIIHNKDGKTNLLTPCLSSIGIRQYEYKSRVFLSRAEITAARERLGSLSRPLITINVQSREKVKVWPVKYWAELVASLVRDYTVVQLGGDDEPEFEGVVRMAGQLTLRESMAVLSESHLHIGGVSFLMHAANGLDVPSVIIYGGRETPDNSGYSENENLFVSMPCGPCWLHDSRGDRCLHDLSCMTSISVECVREAVRRKMRSSADEIPASSNA